MVYYLFLTEFGGIKPSDVDELSMNLIDELIWIHHCVNEKNEKEMKKARHG